MTDYEPKEQDLRIRQTLSNWSLIELLDDASNTLELLVWGEPTDRPPNHFELTSPVRKIVDEVKGESCLVYTKNSLYKVIGSGSHHKFPLAAYEMLSKGFGPDEVRKFYLLKSKTDLSNRPRHTAGPLKGKVILNGPVFDD